MLFAVSAGDAQGIRDIFDLYKKEAELTIGFNNRRTHIHSDFGVIYGLKAGLNFDRRLKNTFGLNSTIISLGAPNNEQPVYQTARLHFLSIAEEYVYFKRQRFSLSTYASFGYGINQYELANLSGQVLESGRGNIVPMELGLQGAYLILTWLDLRLGGGWRFMLYGNQPGLSGYFFKVGLGFKYKAFKQSIGLIE